MTVTFSNTSAPSNKPPVTLIAYGYEEGYAALIPKIDKIAFTYDIPASHREPVLANLFGLAGEKQAFKSLKSYGTHRYQKRFSLTHPDSTEQVLIEAVPKQPKDNTKKPPAFMRMEFNPARLGPAGMEFFRDQLVQVFLGEHPWEAIAVNCTVTRLDVAVDLVGVRAADLLIEQAIVGAKAKPGKTWCIFAPSGALETAYIGFKKGKATPIVAYNKAQQLADNGKALVFGTAAHARLEMRMQPNRSIASLPKMKNPFVGAVVIDPTKPISPPETLHAWAFFLDACRMRGRNAALSLLPSEDMREAYANALTASDRGVWKPKKLWSFWPKTLQQSGLWP